MELEFFWGRRESVPAEHVKLFTEYLSAYQRTFSRNRDDLCHLFYGETYDRLRQERIDQMQRAFKSAGLAFEPTVWSPGTRIRIWRDDSIVLAKPTEVETGFEGLLPRWLEPQRLPPTSRDPLGLQNHAERIANELLPGITVFTSRAGYYGLLAWAIRRVNEAPCPAGQTRRERFNCLERALALCEFIHHGASDNACTLLGQRSKTRILQSAQQDRFRVPERILRNQSSAGAFRLYATSLVSAGFAVEARELGVDGLLPFSLNKPGQDLARYFERRVPDDFWEFALSNRALDRETLRAWGRQLCFSTLGKQYRDTFVNSFFQGDSPDAEARYNTARRLFELELLTGEYAEPSPSEDSTTEATSEEDAAALEEVTLPSGLNNFEVLLHFHEQSPVPENRRFQKASVFEYLGLGLSALFGLAIESLWSSGRCTPAELAAHAAEEKDFTSYWSSSLEEAGRQAPPAGELLNEFFSPDNSPLRRAAVGGVLLARVLQDRATSAVGAELAGNPVLTLTEALRRDRSLRETYPALLEQMVARHEQVSTNKGRQRWCYFDGAQLVKDDLQRMSIGLHAMRFPQLFSLCRDVKLTHEDLTYGT